jgi:adenylate kinase
VRLVLLGPPGAGKGTQAARLEERFGLDHISTGEIFRDHAERATPLGLEARRYMDAGELVPDDVVVRMVADRLGSAPAAGFILDGFPRNVAQAEELDRELRERRLDLDAVIAFDIDREEVVRRLSARRTCPSCQRAYNLVSAPPRSNRACDDDGTPIVQREDDREEVDRNRLQVYDRQTAPVRAFYEERALVRPVDAEGSENEVFERVLDALADRVTGSEGRGIEAG